MSPARWRPCLVGFYQGIFAMNQQMLSPQIMCRLLGWKNVLEKFWEIEDIPNPNSRVKNILDEEVHEKFKKTISYDESKQQYMVEIPYKSDVENLSDNLHQPKLFTKSK